MKLIAENKELDDIVGKVVRGEADIARECLDKVEEWIDKLCDEDINDIKKWVVEMDIPTGVEEKRRWMKSMLSEDSSFVIMTLEDLIRKGKMSIDLLELDEYDLL
jgi:hypothetical protein